jgi:serine protease Do
MNEPNVEKTGSAETKEAALDKSESVISSENAHLGHPVLKALVAGLLAGAIAGSFFGFLGAKVGTAGTKGLLQEFQGKVNQKDTKSTEEQPAAKQNNKVTVIEEDSAVISAVEKASPAVVSIIITKDVPKIDSFFSNPFLNDPFFNPFGFSAPEQDDGQKPQTEKQEIGGGTGFIVDENGYIVTNKHVVQDPQAEYTVINNEGKKMNAQVLARDPFNDIAILKVDEKNLPVVALGDSDRLKIGQTVIAIGNSLGEFRNTVSKGIISGLKRNVSAGDGMGQSETLEEVIQTDAAINPGNSGGPLLNVEGQVVAINVAMAQGAENIGFAIPVNQIKKNLQSVKDNGKIVRPYLGIRYLIINDQIQAENNLPQNYGALVVRGNQRTDLAVIPGSPADKAGIVENDIILEIDGKKVDQENDLSKMIRNKNIGDEVTLKVWSKGTEKTVKLKLEEAN